MKLFLVTDSEDNFVGLFANENDAYDMLEYGDTITPIVIGE